MWSIGVYDYGLTDAEFWSMTPAQFYALGKRFDSDTKHQDLGFGIVSSVVANCNRDPKKKKKPFEPSDFMPKYEEEVKKSAEDLHDYWRNVIMPVFGTKTTVGTKNGK